MDNSSKDSNVSLGQNQPNNSGEIFSSQEESGYQEAIAPPQEQSPYGGSQYPEGQTSSPVEPSADSGFPPTDAPPPFAEDNRKKYIFFALVAIVIIGIALFIANILLKKKAAPSSEKITLNYWGLWEGAEIFQPIIDEYKNNHQNISINYIKQDQKLYRERLQTALEKGEGPDIFRFHNTWRPMFIRSLSPVPSSVYSEGEFEKTFYPVVQSDLKQGNNYYGIPLEIDGLLLFYNEDILKSANVAVPKTWEDVRTAASKLTVKEKGKIVTSAIALGTAENIEHFSDILGLMMLQNNTQLNKSLFSCSDSSTTTCAVEALSFYRRFADAPNDTWDETLENSIIAFAGGKAAMIFAPSWQALVLKEISPNLNFKTAQVPQLPCEKQPCPSVNWATYWVEGVSNKSKYQKEAWEFLKYLSEEATMKKLYALQIQSRKLFGEPYSRVDLAKELEDNPYLAPLMEEVKTMKSFYSVSRTFDGSSGLNSKINTYLKNAVNSLSQGTSPETALQTADNGFKETFTFFNISTTAQ